MRYKTLIAELADALETFAKKEACQKPIYNELIRKARAEESDYVTRAIH